MNRVFADTSAIYAILVATDANHARAKRILRQLSVRQAALVTSSYVLVESYALLGRRVGLDGVASLRDDLEPLLDVVWIDAALHERGLELLLERGLRTLSLVDAVSFVVIRAGELDEVFAFDRDFQREGFTLVE